MPPLRASLLAAVAVAALLCAAAGPAVAAPRVTEFALPAGSTPTGVAGGPDGNVWFTEQGRDRVGRITPSGVVTEFALPAGFHPEKIVAGAGGHLWVASFDSARIARVTTAGVVTSFDVWTVARDLAVGPDGSVWWVGGTTVARIDEHGVSTNWGIGQFQPTSYPGGMTVGADGRVWFTQYPSPWLGVYDPSTYAVTERDANQANLGFDLVGHPVLGPDGAIWMAHTMSGLQRVDPATARVDRKLTIGLWASDLVTGPDGRLWLTSLGTAGVHAVDLASGAVESVPGVPADARTVALAVGGDGNVWFAEADKHRIGRVTLDVAGRPDVLTGAASAVTATTATLAGTVDARGATGVVQRFEWGLTSAYGSTTAGALTGLAPATTYHYRLVAETGRGTVVVGDDRTFTTAAATPPVAPVPPVPEPDLPAPKPDLPAPQQPTGELPPAQPQAPPAAPLPPVSAAAPAPVAPHPASAPAARPAPAACTTTLRLKLPARTRAKTLALTVAGRTTRLTASTRTTKLTLTTATTVRVTAKTPRGTFTAVKRVAPCTSATLVLRRPR